MGIWRSSAAQCLTTLSTSEYEMGGWAPSPVWKEGALLAALLELGGVLRPCPSSVPLGLVMQG